MTNSVDTADFAPSPNHNADAVLIDARQAIQAVNAATHAACETGTDADALNSRRLALLTTLLALRATTPEGIRAKAGVVGAFYYWTHYKEPGCDLVASLLSDLGVTVPYGTATA
jgi:hypothetical protein